MNLEESGQNLEDAHACLHAIIPAGGAGTRLWPLSRASRPKFLLDLLGHGDSLLEATILRLAPLSASITVVTGTAHAKAVGDQVRSLQVRGTLSRSLPVEVVVEPSPRDSMPAIGLAAALINRRYGEDAVIGSFAADHVLRDPEAFRDTVKQAVAAANAGFITTVGISPQSPSTAFGYIQPATAWVTPHARLVEKFVEKPTLSVAERYVEEGFLWNAGMFITRASFMMGHLRRLHPQMEESLQRLAKIWNQPDARDLIAELWGTLPRIAIDHALAEPVAAEGGVAVVQAPESIHWSDIGDFAALSALRSAEPGPEPAGSTEAPEGAPVLIDSDAALVLGQSGKTVVVVGIPGAVVVDTPDALLVTTVENNQRVKEAVEALRAQGRSDVL